VVLSEGGPTLNGALVAAGVVDEWCASVAPLVAGGTSARAAHGAGPPAPLDLPLRRVLADDDGYLFLRHARA
jgi:5-amino-6-(5-phosphoribosylamino)uracil reductase